MVFVNQPDSVLPIYDCAVESFTKPDQVALDGEELYVILRPIGSKQTQR